MLFPSTGLLITLVLQIGLYRCGLPPPSNEITQNFLWNTDAVEWRIGEWEPCTRSEDTGLNDNQGIRRRKITCVMVIHDGIKLEEPVRIEDTSCQNLSPGTPPVEVCSLEQNQDCVVTEYSNWTICCGGTQRRTRSVVIEQQNNGAKCPPLTESRVCVPDEPSCSNYYPFGLYQLKVNQWQQCVPFSEHTMGDNDGILNSGSHSDTFYKHWPQVGTQKRSMSCFDESGILVSLSFCEDKQLPTNTRACIIAQDCVVSDWTDWEVTQGGCISAGGKIRAEEAIRKRQILRLHEGQGSPCPHLVETRTTKENLPLCSDKYKWLISSWSKCSQPISNSSVQCGGGLQYRNITCIEFMTGKFMDPSVCRILDTPPTIQRCEIPCPRDCQVGPWSKWGPCKPSKCPSKHETESQEELENIGYRKRTRIANVPPSEYGVQCPSLEEVQPCQNPQCYVWDYGQWGSCTLDEPTEKCGPGQRSRQVYCTAHDKEVVHNSLCSKLKPSESEPCSVPCPEDCVVSGWSEWSECSMGCSIESDIGVRYRNRTVIGPPGKTGHPCPSKGDMVQFENCNTHGCYGLSWLVLPWTDCNGTCSHGTQTRDVWCMKGNDKKVKDENCKELPKPITVRDCSKDCKSKICVLSDWSDWSECPQDSCINEQTDLTKFKRQRNRVILGGESCGPILEEESCPIPNKICPTYSLVFGSWSHCELAEGVTCGHGLRTRDFRCKDNDSLIYVELKNCLQSLNVTPSSVERCHVDCQTPCQMTEWSHWSSCPQPCSGLRTRTRELIGDSISHPACKGVRLIETTKCPCSEYFPQPTSDWSFCLTNETDGCGAGTRYRSLGCYNVNNHLVDPALCGGSTGIEEEPCLVPCSIDCQMSDWNEWGVCNKLCGPGIHHRSRTIERHAANGGRPCGETVQTKVCNTPCNSFQWTTEPWSQCKLPDKDKLKGCGEGEMFRLVRCIHINTGIELSEEYCDWTTRPDGVNLCTIACPGDCVLSSWSDWSICPKDCLPSQEQQRTRLLLRSQSPTGANCPIAIQTQPCHLNFTCFKYSWKTITNVSCLPLGGSPCGEGMTVGAVYCERSDGRTVLDRFCDDQPKPSPLDKWCYIDCPVDCALEGWSPWNSSCSCNDTGVSRRAYTAMNPSATGRQCPMTIEQWKPCPAVPCYTWSLGPWSACQLHGAACGHGVTTRNVTCVRTNDGETVESTFCGSLGQQKPLSWQNCYVSCGPGCTLSEWSQWSHCHGDCEKETIGYETRSRTVISQSPAGTTACTDPLWETRDCRIPPCMTYDWALTPNADVICRRSDGLVVMESSCNQSEKPKSMCSTLQGSYICTKDICMPDDKLQCDQMTTWEQLKHDPRVVEYIFCFGFVIKMVIIIGVILYFLRRSKKQNECKYHKQPDLA
ncbi:thrombospondin type-1 domain-containing protein 7A-like [Rhopalosiphum padi]|uniref:thrombospondin type-1 domain-containing protein 7A-like n=1 Tax=Rhopalosiphum padi TaxID=40932 RepID=UPI00298E6683|nr:thrombospondin type-1 domain-containing protein 7A-like [Rhopalosiphum padi]